MPTERKVQQVAHIQERLSRCTVAVTTRNNGISVAQVNELRRKLRAASVEYLVVKNNLAAIAADNAGKPGLRDILQGPTAIAFGYGEVVDPAKTLHEEIRSADLPVELIGAIIDGQTLDAAAVRELALLPPKPILITKVMGGLLGPLYGLSHALNYHISGLARALDGIRQQMEASQAPATPPAEAPAPEESEAPDEGGAEE